MAVTRECKVGIVEAFTGHYASTRLIARFLELMGVNVIRSGRTTPAVLESGTTLTSADLCLPLRTYVGHVHSLLVNNPDLTHLVAPNVLSEDGKSSTCAKYRDVGGVALRSLGGTVKYLASRDTEFADEIAALAGPQVSRARGGIVDFPTVLMPNIRRLDLVEARNTCYDVYADVLAWPRWHKLRVNAHGPMKSRLDHAVRQAYADAMRHDRERLDEMLGNPGKPRLVAVGRRYMVGDPALTCDLVRWFRAKGACVVTVEDVPPEKLHREAVHGFYDSHKEEESLIRWAAGKADGVICVGSFGCHPDAFQLDYLAGVAHSLGLACWPIRYDECAGHTGFFTRYETILAFLEQRRDARVSGRAVIGDSLVRDPAGETASLDHDPSRPSRDAEATPLITWPYAGEVLNRAVSEAMWQLGLERYAVPPAAVTEDIMLLGNDKYTESCSPYACSTGSFRHSLNRICSALEEEVRSGGPIKPRRIIMLMLHGEGPCTFGWYSIAQRKLLPPEFETRLKAGGHTLEMATGGMDGLPALARQLCSTGRSARLKPVVDCLDALERGQLKGAKRAVLLSRLARLLVAMAVPVWGKLRALERLRACMLIARAHELEPGAVRDAYEEGLRLLGEAHTLSEIHNAERRAKRLISQVPGDGVCRPRVVVVGEVYVMLTSFANRGTTEGLLGREGIEAMEGITLSRFVAHSLQEMARRAVGRMPPVRSILGVFREHNIELVKVRLRDGLSRPFLVHEVGGEGAPSVAAARRGVEEGCDGVMHLHPFKCMPEAISKDALKELAELYGVRYLALSFDKEIEIERLRTEVATYAAVLKSAVAARGTNAGSVDREIARRRRIGRALDRAYARYRLGRHTD